MMTQRDFIALARIVRELDADDETRRRLVAALSNYCRGAYPRFNAVRFADACQPEEETR